jgi:hypothetical protein
LRRWVAYLHTPQICGTCRGVKVGIHGLLNWTAANLYLGCDIYENKSYPPLPSYSPKISLKLNFCWYTLW